MLTTIKKKYGLFQILILCVARSIKKIFTVRAFMGLEILATNVCFLQIK